VIESFGVLENSGAVVYVAFKTQLFHLHSQNSIELSEVCHILAYWALFRLKIPGTDTLLTGKHVALATLHLVPRNAVTNDTLVRG
jgi:hypothetical protein